MLTTQTNFRLRSSISTYAYTTSSCDTKNSYSYQVAVRLRNLVVELPGLSKAEIDAVFERIEHSKCYIALEYTLTLLLQKKQMISQGLYERILDIAWSMTYDVGLLESRLAPCVVLD